MVGEALGQESFRGERCSGGRVVTGLVGLTQAHSRLAVACSCHVCQLHLPTHPTDHPAPLLTRALSAALAVSMASASLVVGQRVMAASVAENWRRQSTPPYCSSTA